jgi:hypothetical protein
MEIEALYRRPRTTRPEPGHKIYPYLLRGIEITRPNQVWAMDITYIPMARGFVYLAVVLDWFSRRVLSWQLSITMEARGVVGVQHFAGADTLARSQRPAGRPTRSGSPPSPPCSNRGQHRVTIWRFFQLSGAACLIIVVLTHVAEAYHIFPAMGWGVNSE